MKDWWTNGAPGIEEGLGLYQKYEQGVELHERRRKFDAIEHRVRRTASPYLTPGDLRVVIQFKMGSGRRQRILTLSEGIPRGEVRRATGNAYALASSGNVRAGLAGLDRLSGIGLPMATAILSAMDPARFPIIDRFAMGEVANLITTRAQVPVALDEGLMLLADALRSWTSSEDLYGCYEKYRDGLLWKADKHGVPARDVERSLFGHHVMRVRSI